MSEYGMETRRRSRSKTPFLRSSCDHENCDHAGDEPHVHHHKKKTSSLAPNVKTIVEETVEVTSSSSLGTGSDSPSKMTQTKIKTSDYSSEESPENKNKISTKISTTTSGVSQKLQQKQKITETRTSTMMITKTKKIGGDSLTTSTPKGNNNYSTSFASQLQSRSEGNTPNINISNNKGQYQQHRQTEYTQNVLNAERELGNSKNKSISGFLGSSFGDKSLNFNASDHIAYMEYKNAGEYWRTTPKTDYTYSELSPHRRVLAPGVIAMPNMSRQSLDNHSQRISYMIKRNPAQENHIRRRYESPKYLQNREATERLIYESGDEVDYSNYQTYGNRRNFYNYNAKQNESWLMRFITRIVTIITTVWSAITGRTDTSAGRYTYTYNSSSIYQTKLAGEKRSFFGSIAQGMLSTFLTIVRGIYVFIASVLCLDTWLLQSSNAESRGKKRFLISLLILLPLLLLAGIYYYLYPNEPFPPKSFSEYHLELPEIPKINISQYINQNIYNEYKAHAANHFDNVKDWSHDYFLYLKTLTQNLVDEGRKIFQSESEEIQDRVEYFY